MRFDLWMMRTYKHIPFEQGRLLAGPTARKGTYPRVSRRAERTHLTMPRGARRTARRQPLAEAPNSLSTKKASGRSTRKTAGCCIGAAARCPFRDLCSRPHFDQLQRVVERRSVPRAAARRAHTASVERLGDGPQALETGALHVADDGHDVGGALVGERLTPMPRDLLRHVELRAADFDAAPFGGGERVLGQLCNRLALVLRRGVAFAGQRGAALRPSGGPNCSKRPTPRESPGVERTHFPPTSGTSMDHRK
jgi:hypothetical protein